MNYKKLVCLITLSSHIFIFTGNLASRALNNPARTKSFEEMSEAEKLALAQTCAYKRISEKIVSKNLSFAEVPETLGQILNFPLYDKLDEVKVYGITFNKHIVENNKVVWFQKPDYLTTETKYCRQQDPLSKIPLLSTKLIAQRRERS